MGVRITSLQGGGSSSGSSLDHQFSLTLNNASQKAVASPGVTLVAGHASYIYLPFRATLDFDIVQAYNGVDTDSRWAFSIGPTGPSSFPFGSLVDITSVIASPDQHQSFIVAIVDGLVIDNVWTGYTVSYPMGAGLADTLAGQSLLLWDIKDVAAYTAGDAGNTCDLSLVMLVYDLATKSFVTTTESGWNPTTRTFS